MKFHQIRNVHYVKISKSPPTVGTVKPLNVKSSVSENPLISFIYFDYKHMRQMILQANILASHPKFVFTKPGWLPSAVILHKHSKYFVISTQKHGLGKDMLRKACNIRQKMVNTIKTQQEMKIYTLYLSNMT